jgi:hypothetical protein
MIKGTNNMWDELDKKFAHTFQPVPDNIQDVVSLWRGVIMQHLIDLRINSDRKKMYRVLRRNALLWIFSNKKGFSEVCEYAHVSGHKVRKLAKWLLKNRKQNLLK